MQYKWVKRIIVAVVFTFMAGTMSIPAHAEAETNTAGSTMGKETTAEDGIATYANVQEGWKQDSKGWWYQYSNGAYPKSTWRQIKGKWYYFNSNGYWVDNNKHETGTIKGIDISEWQGDIDWSAVKNDGYEYAIVRLGYSYRSNNLLKFVKDKKYDQNMKNANAVDIPVGVYLYSKAKTVDEAKAEAQYVINTMQGYQVSYPVVFDLEDPSQSNLGKNQLGAIAKAFCTDIRRAGYTPMLYCNEYWYSSLIDVTQLKNVDKWIARYANTYTETIDRDIWQCCATGRVSGIDGDVDIDFSYKDYTETITPRKYAEVSKWIQDENGWWYRYGNGEYPAGGWEKIKGIWYLFDSDGYLLTGWQKISGKWYYMNENGAMQTGWQKINNRWYYLKESGAMTTGWLQLGDTWYYLNSSGVMITGWSHIGKYDYYFETSGAMVTGWKEINNSRYYFYLQNDENNNAGASYGSKAVNVEIDGWTIKEDGKAYDLSEIDKKIEEIKKYTTIPYVYGGSSTLGWVCSGFTQWAVRYLSGVTIPRTSQQQATGGTPVNINKMKEWKPGDVLVYSNGYSYDHVALYLGKGMLMHALNSKYGTVIQDIQYYESWDSKNHLAMVRRYF